MARRWALVAIVAFVGCESLRHTPTPPAEPPPLPTPLPVPASPPLRVAATQPAVVPVAATAPHIATPLLPQPDNDPLTLVAECLERGDRASAAVHLEAYVRLHPEQLMFRAQLA